MERAQADEEEENVSEMVERVAVALAKTNGGGFYDPNFYTEEQRNVWRLKARDAIEEMREPTEGMLAAGKDRDDPFDLPAFAEEHWQAMIHEALAGDFGKK